MGSVADMAQEESDIEMPDSDSDAFQESDIELPDGMASSCCRNDCFRDMEKNHVWAKIAMQRLHSNLEELDQDGKNRVWYAQVLNMNRTAPDGPGRRTYPWHGVVLCQKGLSQVLQCPLKKLRLYTKLVSQGQLLPPQDARLVPMKKAEPKREDVESFFLYLWEHLAESLAIPRDQEHEICNDDDNEDARQFVEPPTWVGEMDADASAVLLSTWQASIDSRAASRPKVEKRWLPTMTTAELYTLYEDMHAEHEEKASLSTFKRVWKKWHGIMGIRPVSTHSRCDDCAKYAKYRRNADNQAMMAAVTQAYSTHIHEVLSDRHIMTGLEVKVEQAMRNEDAELPHLILSIDAMDKAKWQIPRQLDSSKRLAALWRPSLHFVGVLMPGVMEYYAILEADQPSNSDSQQTILARALEHAEEIITSRGKKMPGRIIIQSDNTAKEGRNSQMMTWAALLVQAEKFREVSLMLFRVGHTHCRLDQRFGVIGAKLALARSLESPAEYVSYLQEHYTPSRGVKLIVEEIHAVHHWREFVAPLGTHFAGMQGSRTTADAAHCLRVVRRDNLGLAMPGFVATEISEASAGGCATDPVLLAKHWISSKMLSQNPTTLLTGPCQLDFAKLLNLKAPKLVLTEDSIKKFAKTATTVLEAPWNMETASAYLNKWLQKNKDKIVGELPQIDFIIHGAGHDQMPQNALEDDPTWQDFAPQGAVEVKPVAKKAPGPPGKKSHKRPAAAPAMLGREEPPQGAVLARSVRARLNARAALRSSDPADMDTEVEQDEVDQDDTRTSDHQKEDVASPELDNEGDTECPPHGDNGNGKGNAKGRGKGKGRGRGKGKAAAPKAVPKVKAAPKAAPVPGQFLHYGCSKCRYKKRGCPSRCQPFARDEFNGYSFDGDSRVVRHQP